MDNRLIRSGGAPATRLALHFDSSICRWCHSCELACSLFHDGVCSPGLARMRLWVNTLELEVEAELCAQCRDAPCAQACPVDGAMTEDPQTGVILIVGSECIACGACAAACPFNTAGTILFRTRTDNAYVKCDLCGGDPQCIAFCPTGALSIGVVQDRDSPG